MKRDELTGTILIWVLIVMFVLSVIVIIWNILGDSPTPEQTSAIAFSANIALFGILFTFMLHLDKKLSKTDERCADRTDSLRKEITDRTDSIRKDVLEMERRLADKIASNK